MTLAINCDSATITAGTPLTIVETSPSITPISIDVSSSFTYSNSICKAAGVDKQLADDNALVLATTQTESLPYSIDSVQDGDIWIGANYPGTSSWVWLKVSVLVDCSSESVVWNPSTDIDLLLSPSSTVEIVDYSSEYSISNSLCTVIR